MHGVHLLKQNPVTDTRRESQSP